MRLVILTRSICKGDQRSGKKIKLNTEIFTGRGFEEVSRKIQKDGQTEKYTRQMDLPLKP